MKFIKKKFFLLIFFIFFISLITSQEIDIMKKEAENCLNKSEEIIFKMEKNGFPVLRLNYSLKEAKELFSVQLILEERGKKVDYSKIIAYCKEIEELSNTAYLLKDKIDALIYFYENTLNGKNVTEIENIFEKIDKEMKSERYEFVSPLIDEAYSSILEFEAKNTALNIFYNSTRNRIEKFFSDNWDKILITILILIFLFFILRKPIKKRYLRRKLFLLELRKKSLKKMIFNIQDLYFNKGEISESEYSIKSKKLGELIRDIERQISLLEEEIARIDYKNKKNTKI